MLFIAFMVAFCSIAPGLSEKLVGSIRGDQDAFEILGILFSAPVFVPLLIVIVLWVVFRECAKESAKRIDKLDDKEGGEG